ncbi:DUF7524 family protein [Methanimicrococcus blatticola]|uniref:Uncharacterized protein n=1 Tax=Methanimicrococcus blatticola TaxID=91560 RepID=A0A484F400_9EURY|nr:hypothetical protein [Methanimicrococcus blatticola]MBZ3935956.1 hypothetical protein [Methanimicrococcus blatticola]MCC2509431.1 hypothetical protein [Methanimicrococcus blatticola]TDQ68313.1 hypothetical protein C7391_1254 [Methanimicrococcus blatticola]
MKEVLQDIYIGRQNLDSIEFKYNEIEVPLYKGEDREFQIFIKNFASPTHITFLPDDSIRDYLILVPSKHHIQNNEYVRIVIRIPYNAKQAAEGMFYVITGYGAQKKGFKLSVGSDKVRASILSESGDLSGERVTNNPAGDIYRAEGPMIPSVPERAQLIIDDDDEDETKPKKQKPSFSVKKDWNENKAKKEGWSTRSSSNSEKYKPSKPIAPLSTAEKVSFFVSVILIAILVAMFVYIQITDINSIFNFDQTVILALITGGFIVFIVLLLSMFLKRTNAN